MKPKFRKYIQVFLEKACRVFTRHPIGEVIAEAFIQAGMQKTVFIDHENVSIKLSVPNKINRFRAASFSYKEPETLKWIDSLPVGSTLWDIGANVGLYSIYAAKKRNCTVFAFEPSVFNLELLARNIFINGLQNKISILPLPLAQKTGLNHLHMSTTDWGGALSSFGAAYGWNGKAMEIAFNFQTFGVNLDEASETLHLPSPNFIKMDVDGIEHLILQGGEKALSQISGILVEINDDFEEQKKISEETLKKAGLSLKYKLQGEGLKTSEFANVFNQIWIRK